MNWDQRGFGITDDVSQFYLGNMYATNWPTIEDVRGVVTIFNCMDWCITGTELHGPKPSRIVYQHVRFP